jgi:hypothetical protein
MPHLRFHDLRHTHAPLLFRAGVPVKVVSERLGHKSIKITLDTYCHVLPDMQEVAAARIDLVFRVPHDKTWAECGHVSAARKTGISPICLLPVKSRF